MKNISLIFGLCMMLCGCGEDAPPLKSNSYTPPAYKKSEPAVVAPAPSGATNRTAQPASTAATAPAKDTKVTPLQRPATQILNDATAVVDYGMGTTPISAKQKQSDKIQSIQNQHNQDTQKALK
jgi:hypothetical protein